MSRRLSRLAASVAVLAGSLAVMTTGAGADLGPVTSCTITADHTKIPFDDTLVTFTVTTPQEGYAYVYLVLNGTTRTLLGVPPFNADTPTSMGEVTRTALLAEAPGATTVGLLLDDGTNTVCELTLPVDDGQPHFTTDAHLPSGTVGTPYPSTPVTYDRNETTIANCAVVSSDLPAGMTLAPGRTADECATLSGTPATAGTYGFAITLSYEPPAPADAAPTALLSVTRSFVFAVSAAPLPPTPPDIPRVPDASEVSPTYTG